MGYIGLVNHQTYTKVLIWVYIKINCCVAACGISSRENSEGKEIFAISCDVANIQFVEKGGLEMSNYCAMQKKFSEFAFSHHVTHYYSYTAKACHRSNTNNPSVGIDVR